MQTLQQFYQKVATVFSESYQIMLENQRTKPFKLYGPVQFGYALYQRCMHKRRPVQEEDTTDDRPLQEMRSEAKSLFIRGQYNEATELYKVILLRNEVEDVSAENKHTDMIQLAAAIMMDLYGRNDTVLQFYTHYHTEDVELVQQALQLYKEQKGQKGATCTLAMMMYDSLTSLGMGQVVVPDHTNNEENKEYESKKDV
jgi:hypothetical protein